ncbi:hypothetical protein GCM10010420_23320 [Streptomyces glaucosporus]|uniref:Uncharacterized protein n=1 Tax=Streptomyces glaucosporus TaxID=284044 RepID=A0ABN3I7V8_9ACTN
MPLISTLARVEAAATGRAQPLATVRHRHLAERPLVLVPLTTAGEAGAPLGAMVGTDRDAPRLLVVPQPRDRTLRFAFLAELADAVLPHLESAQDAVEVQERTETDPETGKRVKVEVELCADAPQLIVPNTAGISYVRLLGRSTRFRRTAEEDPDAPYPAPARLPLLGRWLTHYGERARVPGSSLLLAMTELLGRHWATGQSRLEDQHLGALLAWIGAGEGASGAEAALRVELERDGNGLLLTPPAGPATDPAFDNRRLAPAIARHDAGLPGAEEEIRELVASQLRPTWDAVWRGLDLLRALPPGARVADRWKRDRWSYTAHRDRLRAGEPPQPRRDDAVTAARKLAARETALAELAAQEALDDPLVMAERRLAGEAFAGEVVEVEMAYSEGRRPMPRPLVTVRTDDRPHLEEDDRVYRALADGRTQPGVFVASPGPGLLTVRLTGGMGRGKVPEAGSVPEKGETVCWTLFEHAPRGGPDLPDPEETPWTHGGPPDPDALDAPDPVTAEDLL